MSLWVELLLVLIIFFIILRIIALKNNESPSINEDNQYLYGEKECHTFTEITDNIAKKPQENYSCEKTVYEKTWKRLLDCLLSFSGLIILSPLFFILYLVIKIDDRGPVFFKQKRVGVNKTFFYLHKFRSMKMSTPHDIPTHMLDNPDQYITKIGKIMRKTSLDELPQLWDIFRGKLSIIGPRPALWNQNDLVAERDLYYANNVLPGLTGWAQINGRDELAISEKAKFDGEYVKKLHKGGGGAFIFDCKCFIGTIFSVLRCDGIVEGGTRTK